MNTNGPDLAGFIPGLEPDQPRGNVRAAYEKSITKLLEAGVLNDQHAGLCAHLLRLAEIIDTERKAYAVSAASREAIDIMKILNDVAASQGDDEFAQLVRELENADA